MSSTKRILASFLALIMVGDIILPTAAWALSSGPSQPEVQGFKPASAPEMVDLFTGDMSYNIPLLEVEGYPVNLFYNGGVGMDQEASWVGLGWNLNPGVVERNLRGIPDDFNGDAITRTINLRPNRTYGVSYGVGLQLFSVSSLTGNLGLSVAPSFNNYGYFNWDIGVNFSMRSTRPNKSSFTGGLGMTSSSNRGLRLQPTVGFDKGFASKQAEGTAGLNFGLSLDSREGLSNLSFGVSLEASKTKDSKFVSRSTLADGTKVKVTETKSIKAKGAPIGVGTSFPIGLPTYTPQIGLPMRNRSISFSFTVGGAIQGIHPNTTLGASFSEQKLISDTRVTPAYGYLHLGNGQHNKGAQLDINREKDGPYSGDRAALPIAQLTNDLFSVTGQGVSGSYRAFRAETGHVFDPSNGSNGSGGSAGLDVGAGLVAHGGARIMVNHSASHSGDWSSSGNQAGQRLQYKSLAEKPELEDVYFREANEATVEQDSSLWTAMHGASPRRFTLPGNGQYDCRLGSSLTDGGTSTPLPLTNHRMAREPRAQLFTYLDHQTAETFGLEAPPTDPYRKPHHMSEVTVLAKDGQRHIYGIAAYNVEKVEHEFNTASNPSQELVPYDNTDLSTGNVNGRDHYYSRTSTPAYPYAFLLTAVVSNDYSDIDGVRGPSDDDLGNYTKFGYERVTQFFEWRTPSEDSPTARFQEGRPFDTMDNKGILVHGRKEVWHLTEIESRNQIAIFHINDQDREDARALGQDGTFGARSVRLDSISLYEKDGYLEDSLTAIPIKRVHFRYSQALCSGAGNNEANTGKLTLEKVWFTYGTSRMGVTSPYLFDYRKLDPAFNVDYNAQDQDRWGNYKPAPPVGNEHFPYAEQDTAAASQNARQWMLHSITLPSGGRITAEVEADDYAHVQNRRAMVMTTIKGITASSTSFSASEDLVNGSDGIHPYMWFDVPDELESLPEDTLRNRFFKDVGHIYYRVRSRFTPGNLGDWVSGYMDYSAVDFVMVGNELMGRITIQEVGIDEENPAFQTHPIFRSALEYLQLNYPNELGSVPTIGNQPSPGESFFLALAGSIANFFEGLSDFFQGPNQALAVRGADFCESIVLDQSWIRLNDPDRRKVGGGHRVRQVAFADGWDAMEPTETEEAFTYKRRYSYGNEHGSWGVAAYEPMMGADENPFRQPVYTKVSNALAPDQRFYLEEPFGEMLFPSPVVGYSRVEVEDVVRDDLRNTQGTGRVVSEFYTARDFPTITSRTGIDPQRRRNNANLMSLLGFKQVDHMHASQGFTVETNDMHGKPKRTTVLPEGSDLPVSYVAYHYRTEPMGNNLHLTNTETVIDPYGNIGRAEIGRDHEFVADTREFSSRGMSGGADVKFELLYAVIAAIPVPLVLPQLSWETTKFKTGVLVKKVHRFGRLHMVEKMENGSVVTTENLAYDALTGEALVTRTKNDFKDPIYSMSFPAYWHYNAMGPAYRNIGVQLYAVDVSAGPQSSSFSHPQAGQLFTPGDELALVPVNGGASVKAWVDEVVGDQVTVTRKHLALVAAGTYDLQVVRSGYRNLQAATMMQLTSLSNPLDGLSGNLYQNLVNASVTEYGSDWPTDCACLPEDPGTPPMNPWVLNLKGVWRTHKEHVWLTDRTRSVTNNNSNIRRDGVYTSFDPFYKVLNGQWSIDPSGWTASREVTYYSMRSQELENKDALGLYTSATFGYRGALPKSVARNARYQENGFDGLEEPVDPMHCADSHFRIQAPSTSIELGEAHTGRRSVRVLSNQTTIGFTTAPLECPPEPGCELAISVGDGQVIVTGYSGAFSVTPLVQTGDFTFSPTPTGLTFTPIPAPPCEVTFTAIDEAGCIASGTFTHSTN